MALKPVTVDKRSAFLGEACALCKQPLGPGDEIIICPEDATRHHVHCWCANSNKCTAYGCSGHGEVESRSTVIEGPGGRRTVVTGDSKVQTLPTRGFHCAQSCLLISIALAIVLFAVACFGLWAIADYIMVEVLEYQYREPLSGLIPMIADRSLMTSALASFLRPLI